MSAFIDDHYGQHGVEPICKVFARRIVGWRASRTAHTGFVLDALEQALHDRRPLQRSGLVHRRGPWRSFEAVEFATLEWVDWFNHRRLLEPIGNIPPAEADARYFKVLDQTKIAA